jgi:hypothetical protein
LTPILASSSRRLVAEDALFDGLYVLRTNIKITPLQVILRYRDLLRVEQLLRQAKAVLTTRPIYHSSDMAIRGLRDLDRLQEIKFEQDGKRFLLRTPTTGVAGKLFSGGRRRPTAQYSGTPHAAVGGLMSAVF